MITLSIIQESLREMVTHAVTEFSMSLGVSEKVTLVGLFTLISTSEPFPLVFPLVFPLGSFVSIAWDIENCREEDKRSKHQIMHQKTMKVNQ